MQTMVEKQEQVLLYGFSNFIADVGGFLGLLLGVSVFTIYNYVINGIRMSWLFNKK